MVLDLDALLYEIEHPPSQRLARFTATDVYRVGRSPAYDLVLRLDGEPVAFVRSEGLDEAPDWYSIGDDADVAADAQERLQSAAAAYLGEDLPAANAVDIVLAGLAEGAGNGSAACLMWRTLIGGADDDDD